MAELDQEPERVIDVFRLNKKHRLPWVLSIGGTWLAQAKTKTELTIMRGRLISTLRGSYGENKVTGCPTTSQRRGEDPEVKR